MATNSIHPAGVTATEAAFRSILYQRIDGRAERRAAPECFSDLNLDQIVEAVTAGKDEYDLRPFFYAPLDAVDDIAYRHEVFQDLERASVVECLRAFAQRMRTMREHLTQAGKFYYPQQRESWFLDAAALYCETVTVLGRDLDGAPLRAKGLVAFRDYLRAYAASDRFQSLVADIQSVKQGLATIRYCILIRGDSFTIRRYEGEPDYSADVVQTFERFKQGAVTDYAVSFASARDMNHVEAAVVGFVAQLWPEEFRRLGEFWTRHREYEDGVIRTFDREIQFYIAYLEYVARFRNAGLSVCYPRVSKSKAVLCRDGYDFALAQRLIPERSPVVANDFYLRGPERILVVSGPNQGGKTTLARTFGQLHYLARLGCPVAGTEAHTFLFDALLTHFEREEDITTLRGKLEDDLVRIREILNQATPDSIIILNEIFTSTVLDDAILLSRNIMGAIMRLDLLCVCVTFIDELASLGERTVSMVSTVAPDNPAVRTYKIVRKPADGLAYALSIAEKYRVTYDQLKRRIGS